MLDQTNRSGSESIATAEATLIQNRNESSETACEIEASIETAQKPEDSNGFTSTSQGEQLWHKWIRRYIEVSPLEVANLARSDDAVPAADFARAETKVFTEKHTEEHFLVLFSA